MICTSWGDVETEILDSDTHNVLAYRMGDMHIPSIRTMHTRQRSRCSFPKSSTDISIELKVG